MLKNSYEINFTQCNIESSNLLPLRSSAALEILASGKPVLS